MTRLKQKTVSYLGRAHGAEAQWAPSWPMTLVSWGQWNAHPARCSSVSCHIQPPPQLLLLLLPLRPHRLTKLAKLIRARNSSSRDLLPFHPLVGCWVFPISGRSGRLTAEKLIRIKFDVEQWAQKCAPCRTRGCARLCVSAPQSSIQRSDQRAQTARRICMKGAARLAPGRTERPRGGGKMCPVGGQLFVTDSTRCILWFTMESQLQQAAAFHC